MSESKYTPGPWLIDKGEPTYIYENDKMGRTVAVTGIPRYPPRPKEETAANAHLIAAAPELLEALEKAVRLLQRLPKYAHAGYCSFGETDCGCSCGIREALRDGEAAIAKAKGEA